MKSIVDHSQCEKKSSEVIGKWNWLIAIWSNAISYSIQFVWSQFTCMQYFYSIGIINQL